MSIPSNNQDEFYAKLKIKLEESSKWPSLYLYKFIIPNTPDQSAKLLSIFDNLGAVISSNQSKTGKYTSYSIKVKMNNPDHVIAKYKEVGATIKGVISL